MFKCLVPECTESFNTLQGVKIHTARKHRKDPLFSQAMTQLQTKVQRGCEFCHKDFSNKYTLEKHLSRCNQKKLRDQRYETDLKHAVTTATLQTANTLKDQHIEDLKNIVKDYKPTTVINNHNTSVHNNYSKTYTQNNNLFSLKEQMKSIVPITDEQAFKMFESTIGKSMQLNQSIHSLEDLTRHWVQFYLPDSILVTDASRGIAHWKNGDKNNEHIKDPNCSELAKKLQQAISVERIDECLEYVKQKMQANGSNIDVALPLLHNQQLLGEFKTKTCYKLGPMLTKNAKSCTAQAAYSMQQYKQQLPTFVSSVESVYKANMLHILFSPAEIIGQIWISVVVKETSLLITKSGDEVYFTLVPSVSATSVKSTVKSFKWNSQQFLDFIKYCVVQAFDLPNKQLLAVADCMKHNSVFSHLFESKQQAEQNFEYFCDWLTWDRFKERNSSEEQKFYNKICEYEDSLLKTLCSQVS
jgi:hypothetical protein